MGRGIRRIRTTLSQARIEALCKLLAKGHSYRSACMKTGTPTASFFEWKKVGIEAVERIADGKRCSNAEKVLAEFVERLQKAEAEAIDMHVSLVLNAASNGNWTASAWWLERRHPEDWGRHRIDLIGDGDGGDLPPTGDMIQEMISRTVPQDAQANNVARSNP